MAISYPVTPPASPAPAAVDIVARDTTGVTVSPFTLNTQVAVYAGQAMQINVRMPPMPRDVAKDWIAFLLSLKGRAGTFTMGDPTGRVPRGTVPGTPVVDGASQTGGTLNVRGFTASQTGVLKAGDYLQIGTALVINLLDANSDGGGLATLEIWPGLRIAPADGASIITSNTVGLWRLPSDLRQWSLGNPFTQLNFSAVEAL